ncbi:MAG: sn-glycerol-3-phosphate ABC transporter ATP-binding protein UgpC [Alphaproteobacteria bacterium]|nr:sn-glycerol-3-phosphate ABC transporter ATP-binding protein UgpC [Alphaproteobacteria bacterium]
MAVVTLEGLSKRYDSGSAQAVDGVTLTVADGEFMVLLGPSGCGKSTTLRMVAGLESITSGALAIDGARMNDVPAKDRDIAMVFQSYALYPHMDVMGNLAFGLRRRAVPKAEIERRVRDVAATLGLADLLARKPYQLSGGQRQRVALGRAIVRDPKVFLFDEPLSNLDAALRVSMRGELIRLHQRLKATMIYVTHDQVEAMTMGSRICIMNRGRVVQIGAPLDVYRRPANTFVAGFLGNPPMNLLPARVAAAQEGLEVGALALPLERAAHLPPGMPVTFGVRAEDVAEVPHPRAAGGGIRLAAEVATVEPLGAETILGLQIQGSERDVMARVGRDSRARRGDRIEAWLDPAAVQLFDAATGDVIPA